MAYIWHSDWLGYEGNGRAKDHAAMAESKPASNRHTLVAVSQAQASTVQPYDILTGQAIKARAEPKTVRPWPSQSRLVTGIL
jgi:hypothetical protein